MRRRSAWWRHGAWNTLEHATTRASDSVASLILLLVLNPATFSRLALAQALVAPVLLLSISPETAIYRHFALWREEGPEALAARMRRFRQFAWSKAPAAIVLSVALASLMPEGRWLERFPALLWAFGLALAPQVAGPDREFLRLSLHLRTLNAVNLVQKLSLLGGTALAAILCPGRIDLLAGVAGGSAIVTAVLARALANRALAEGASGDRAPAGRPLKRGAQDAPSAGLAPRQLSFRSVIADSLRSFSLWNHLQGVVTNWVQTMDVFFLGVLRFSATELGLYSAALRLANLTTAAPLAFSNLFSVWLGTRTEGNAERERGILTRFSVLCATAVILQGIALFLLGPWILRLVSHGRWSADDLMRALRWFRWMLGGYAILGATGLVQSWLLLRTGVRTLFLRVHLVWAIASLAVYAVTAALWRADGTAPANVIVAAIFAALLAVRLAARRSPGEPEAD